jgi:hypothetical protein
MKGLAEEKVIIDYVESGCASSVDNVETDKRRYADISSTQMSKKKPSASGCWKAILNV